MSDDIKAAAERLLDAVREVITDEQNGDEYADGIGYPGLQADLVTVATYALEAADRQAALAAEVGRLRKALESLRPRLAQAISYREMPSWRYAHYYSGDARTTDDLLHEANNILDAALDPAPAVAPGASDAGEG